MKKLIIILTMGIALAGCNTDLATEGLSRVTYFPEFVIEGEDFYLLDEGDSYTEPGITVFEGGEEIPYTTTITGRYSGYTGTTDIGNDPDVYTVAYSATNKDGFTSNTTRTVVAVNTGDLVTSIEGAYNCTVTRTTSGETWETLILIWKVADNKYEISCSVGGFYGDGRAFGDDFLARGGTITVNDMAANNFSFTAGFMEGFGNSVTIDEMEVDAANKSIFMHSGTTEFANGSWNLNLVQIQP